MSSTSAKYAFRKGPWNARDASPEANNSNYSSPGTLSKRPSMQPAGQGTSSQLESDTTKCGGLSRSTSCTTPKAQLLAAATATAAAAAAEVKRYTASKASRTAGLDLATIMAKLEKVAQAKAASDKSVAVHSAPHSAVHGTTEGGSTASPFATTEGAETVKEGTCRAGAMSTKRSGSLRSDSSAKLWSGKSGAHVGLDEQGGATMRGDCTGRLGSTQRRRSLVPKRDVSPRQKPEVFRN
jgi:hypothetical protein